MKNVLFATTALIATAGIASADVTVGGDAHMGVIYNGAGAGSTDIKHRMRVTFAGSVETDSGISFTASSRATMNDNADNAIIGHNKVTMKSGGLTLAVGATHGAMKTLARVATFHGFDAGSLYYTAGGSGVDNNVGLGDGGNNVLVRFDSGDFSVAAGMDVDGNTQEIAASYTFNNITIAAGADSNNQWMLAAKYSGGDFSVGLGTNDNSDIVLTTGYNISDATSLGFGLDAASGGTFNAVGVQIAHDLGGATLTGAVGQVGGSTTVASLGVSFSF
jgi:outer membrane protein OmpU